VPLTVRRLLALVLSALVSLTAGASVASAAPATESPWSRPQLLGTSRLPHTVFGETGLAVGMAADGSSLTVWTHHGVHVRWRSVNGHLGPDQLVSPTNGTADDNASVAMAANGTAVITWYVNHSSPNGPRTEMFSRVRSPNGTLGPVQDLGYQAEDLISTFFGPTDGQARFVWAQYQPTPTPQPHGVFISPFAPPGGLLSPAPLDDPSQDTDSTALVNTIGTSAVDAQGDALIIWVDQHLNKLFGRALSRTGNLGPMLTIADSVDATPDPKVALSADGTGYVIWDSGGGPFGLKSHIFARQVNVSGAMGPTLSLGRMRDIPNSNSLAVASSSDGHGVVAWNQSNLGPVVGRILSATHAGATFRISSGHANGPWLVATGRQAVAVWTDWKTTVDQATGQHYLFGLHSRTIAESGVLGKPTVLFPQVGHGQYFRAAAVAGDDKGQIVAAWLVKNYKTGSGQTRPGVSVLQAAKASAQTARAADVAPNGEQYDPDVLARDCIADTLDRDAYQGPLFGGFGAVDPRGQRTLTGIIYVGPMLSAMPGVDCPSTDLPPGETIDDRLLFQEARIIRARRGRPRRVKLTGTPVSDWVRELDNSSAGIPTVDHYTNLTFTIYPGQEYTCFGASVRRLLRQQAIRHGVSPRARMVIGREVLLQRRTSVHSGRYSGSRHFKTTLSGFRVC